MNRRTAHAKNHRSDLPALHVKYTLSAVLIKLPLFLERLVATRHGGTVIFYLLFMAISLVVRIALLFKSAGSVGWDLSLLASFFWGFVYDLAAAGLWALPITLMLTLLPAKWFEWRWARVLTHLVALGITAELLFTAVSEWTFWDEFSVRFNFIAVDYLVYTVEVIGNIRESYNMPAIFAGIGDSDRAGLLDALSHGIAETLDGGSSRADEETLYGGRDLVRSAARFRAAARFASSPGV